MIERGTKATARAEARLAARKLAEATLATEEKRAQQTMTQMESFTATLVPIVLTGCALLIGLLAFLNVRDRQAEVGILRAIGLKSSQVYSIFLYKALFIGLLGALAGVPLGHLVATRAAKSHASTQAELLSANGGLFLLVLLATPLITLIASWIPTLCAVQQDPSETLREA